jgi:MoxR-like ATPase
MNASKPSAFSLLKEMKDITPSQMTAHIKATAQVKTLIASRTAMPSDPSLLGMEDDDEYIGGLKLKLPGMCQTVGMEDIIAFVKAGMNLHFHGKKGSGKSRLIREVVKALNRPTIDENLAVFKENMARVKKDGDSAKLDEYSRLPYQPYTYSCHEETVADDLLITPDIEYDEKGNRKTVLRPGAMLSAWSKEIGGGICILEELDAVMPGRMLACHGLLDGQVKVWKSYVMGERTYTKYDSFACLASSNTRGAGENARTYAGTQIQNAALMSRFALSFEVDFLDHDTEKKFLVKKGVDKNTAEQMLEVADKIRCSPSIDDGISLRDLRNWALAADVWMQTHPKANGSMWENVYKPMAVCAFVTRQADQATRDCMSQFLGIC